MSFGENLELLLPDYLTSIQKSRLKDALLQFSSNGRDIDYDKFTTTYSCQYFKQSDFIKEIRFPHFNDSTLEFEKGYSDSIILSNTCDISDENHHAFNKKECIFAPIIDLNDYVIKLKEAVSFSQERLHPFLIELRSQKITNIFYVPHTDGNEYLVLLDRLFWFPTKELNSYCENIEENKMFSLTLFGYYLFLLKLSFHFCRFPETLERDV